MASNATILRLRRRLKEKEHELLQLQKRIESRSQALAHTKKDNHRHEEPVSAASEVSKRYISAIAEDKKTDDSESKPVVSSGKVSSLLSKWNAGISGVVENKERAMVHGDVKGAQRRFSKRDGKGIVVKKLGDKIENELLIEDDEDIPSWAKNQSRRVLRKSNPKSVTRGVDVGRLQDEIQDADTNDAGPARSDSTPRTNRVSNALAKWGKAAEKEDKGKEEELCKDVRNLKIKDDASQDSGKKGTRKLSMGSPDEPSDPKELMFYLRKKIEQVDREITEAKKKLRELEQPC